MINNNSKNTAENRIYIFFRNFAIGVLSIGSGVTTFDGMTNYARWEVALAVTVGVQLLMIVFAYFLSKTILNQTARIIFLAGGYVLAALVSIFFSFNSFYVKVESEAARRQTASLQLRQSWSETFALIRAADTAKILADASRVVGASSGPNSKSEFTVFRDNFEDVLAESSTAASGITQALGVQFTSADSQKRQRETLEQQAQQETEILSRKFTSELDQQADLQEQILSKNREIQQIELQLNAADVAVNGTDFTDDSLRNQYLENVTRLEADVNAARVELEAKQAAAEIERNTGGSVREDGTVSPSGEGPLYRALRDEAIVLEARFANLNAQLEAARALLSDREAELMLRASNSSNSNRIRIEAELRAQKLQLSTLRDRQVALQKTLETTQASIANAQAKFIEASKIDAPTARRETEILLLGTLIDEINQLVTDGRSISLPSPISSVSEAIHISKNLSDAQDICIELIKKAKQVNGNISSLDLAADLRVNTDDLACPSVSNFDEAGQTLSDRANRLNMFSTACGADQIAPSPTVDDIVAAKRTNVATQAQSATEQSQSANPPAVNPYAGYVDENTRAQLEFVSQIANGVDATTINSNLSEAFIAKIVENPDDHAKFIEKVTFLVEYNVVRAHLQRCMTLINLQDNESLIEAQKRVTGLLDIYSPEAHPFTQSVAAFQRNDFEAIIALIIAIAVDALILVIALAMHDGFRGPSGPTDGPMGPLDDVPPGYITDFHGGIGDGNGMPQPMIVGGGTYLKSKGLNDDQLYAVRVLAQQQREFFRMLLQNSRDGLVKGTVQVSYDAYGMEAYFPLIQRLTRSKIAKYRQPNTLEFTSETYWQMLQIGAQEGIITANEAGR